MKKTVAIILGLLMAACMSLVACNNAPENNNENNGGNNNQTFEQTTVENITVTEGNSIALTDKVDTTKQLNVKIKYANENSAKAATSADVTYTSNNHSAVTVNNNGLITVAGEGTAQITVESVYNNALGAKVKIL